MANTGFDQQYLTALTQRVRGGDADAFTELYTVTYDNMLRRVRLLLRDPDDVHDAMQEIYMSVFTKIGSLKLDRLVLPWMRQIAYHVCCDMLRRELPRRQLAAELTEDILPPMSADNSLRPVYDRDMWDRASAILKDRSPQVFEAFSLRFLAGLKLREIVDYMSVSVTSVKRYIRAARDILKKELGP